MGFLDGIFGDKYNEEYAGEFKRLWEGEKYREAGELLLKWVDKYSKDTNALFALIIFNSSNQSQPFNQLQRLYNIIKDEKYESEYKSWYKVMALKALEKYASNLKQE